MRAGAAIALLACAAAGTAFTLTRAAALAREPIPITTRGMCAPAELLARERLTYTAGVCVIEFPDDGWRPLHAAIALRDGRTTRDGADLATQVSVNDGPAANVALGERWTTHHVSVPPRIPGATRVTLRIEVPPAVASLDSAPPLQFGSIDVRRELTTTRLLRDSLAGALAAMALWWLLAHSVLPLAPLAPRSPKGAGGNRTVGGSPTVDSPPPQKQRDSGAARTPTGPREGEGSGQPPQKQRDSVAAPQSGHLVEPATGAEPSDAPSAAPEITRDSVAARTPTGQREAEGSGHSPREMRDSVAAPHSAGHLVEPGPGAEPLAASSAAPEITRDSVAATGWRGAVVLAVVLFGYFSVWALLRPPYQTPDEVQHHMRATAVLRHPWTAGPGEWSLDPRFTNPLALWTPGSLDKLFFDTSEKLTLAEIAALKQVPWLAADEQPAPETYRRAIASYPTLYYWPMFVLGEAVTRGLQLTPYQSTYAYRLVSAALAAMLWGAVYLVMRRVLSPSDASRELAGIIVAFLVLNPMVPFVSSGINPDAVNVPLAALSILFVWQVMSTGTGAGLATLALIATAWTKPSGLQMIPAFAATGAALWALGLITFERLRLAAAVVVGSAAIAWCGFYAWSPPRFVGGPPVVDRWTTYLGTRWLDLPTTWVTYWGTLGWLEYSLPAIWYQALLALTVISLICLLLRARTPRLFAGYAALFLIAFLAVTLAGEFFYLPTAGYFLQGRHLLPASLGLAGLMWHRARPVKFTFLAVLIAMNVLLLHQTVLRYYTRGWSAVVSALPFSGGAGGANAR